MTDAAYRLAWQQKTANWQAKLVLLALVDSAAEDGTNRPRLQHLRESTGLAAPDIFAALLTLEDAGLLVKAEPGPGLFRLVLAELQ